MTDKTKDGGSVEETHVDEFIWHGYGANSYARWFLMLHRLPAANKFDWDEMIKPFKLFATWKGQRYRVTGASRLGDVWLARDFNRDTGYDHRVSVDELSEFSPLQAFEKAAEDLK